MLIFHISPAQNAESRIPKCKEQVIALDIILELDAKNQIVPETILPVRELSVELQKSDLEIISSKSKPEKCLLKVMATENVMEPGSKVVLSPESNFDSTPQA